MKIKELFWLELWNEHYQANIYKCYDVALGSEVTIVPSNTSDKKWLILDVNDEILDEYRTVNEAKKETQKQHEQAIRGWVIEEI